MVSTTRETRIAETFVEFADALVDDFDVTELLHVLVVRCVELLDITAASLVLADVDGGLRTVVASDERSRLLELLAMQDEHGPCLDCYRSGEPLANVDLRTAGGRWPGFAPESLAVGFDTSSALPLRLRTEVVGALNLLRTGALGDADLRLAQAMADAATISILAYRTIRRSELLGAQLQTALDSRVVIEQAKGVLAERSRIGMDEAFRQLRGYARSHNRHLSELAREIVSGDVDLPPRDVR